MNKVVVLIITHKPVLFHYEIISLKQCFTVLDNYDIVIVCPKGMNTENYYSTFGSGINFHFIGAKWLSSYEGFEKLKVSPLLYQHFSGYEYILFYEPDAFVFKDELIYWCNEGYDYVGAPWLEGMSAATSDSDYKGVGNGGLSLRNVSSHLRVLQSFGRIKDSKTYWKYYNRMNWRGRTVHFPRHLFGFMFLNNFHHLLNDYQGGEDDFWGNYAREKFKWFKVAPVTEALKFSMEVQPRKMFEDNNHELPFGCHAWWRYDLDFWKPHIENFGHSLKLSSH